MPDRWLACEHDLLSTVWLFSVSHSFNVQTHKHAGSTVLGLGLSLLTVYFALELDILRRAAEWYSRQKGSSGEITSVSAHRKGI